MHRNSLEIRKFVAEYFLSKYPENDFWRSILEQRFELLKRQNS